MKMTQDPSGLQVKEVRHEKVTVEAILKDLQTCYAYLPSAIKPRS